jgi:curli biogenesis system outer membrane secretion channel CsgG
MNKLRITLAVLLAGILSGCASKPDAPASVDQAAKAQEEEYVQVQGGLGSRIPRRIKKENMTRANVGSGSPTEQTSGEGVRDTLGNPMPATPPPSATP